MYVGLVLKNGEILQIFTWGAKTPPILAQVEEDPTAELLISVGNISAVYTKTIAKLEVAPNFPTMESAVWKK